MKMKKSAKTFVPDPARERIMKSAKRLFYQRGFINTGINEILADSKAFKKSFYIHFPSKVDLGKAYLLEQEEAILDPVLKVMKRNTTYESFISEWMKVLTRGLRNNYRFGCPYANLSNQTHDEPDLSLFVRQAIDRWIEAFEKQLIFLKWKDKELFSMKVSREIAERILLSYQGALQLYGMTGDVKYIRLLEKELISIPSRI
jgi:AcrR family transcriptional regulator